MEKKIINTHEFAIDSNGILYCVSIPSLRSLSPHRTQLRICYPKLMRAKLISHIHSNILSGHAGIVHTYDKLKEYAWWPRMIQDVIIQLNQCPVCARVKNDMKVSPSQPVLVPLYPWQIVSVDVVGPLPTTKNGNKYILTMVDIYTRYAEVVALQVQNTQTIADAIIEYIVCRHGLPEILVSDRGSPFISDIANTLYKTLSIKRITTTAYHPQANMVERFNKTLKGTLKLWACEQQNDWDELLPYARFAYNNEYHQLIKETPFYVNHGRDARTGVDTITHKHIQQNTSVHEYVNVINDRLKSVQEKIKFIYEQVNNERISELEADNKLVTYNIGDNVYLYNPTTPSGQTAKLVKRWTGPYVIIRKKGRVDYEIMKENKVMTVHVNRLKLVKDIDNNNDIDIYNEALRAGEIELERLENSIKTLIYEKQNAEKEVNSMKQLYPETADSNYADENDYEYESNNTKLDIKNNYIPHSYITYNNLKWKPVSTPSNMSLYNQIYKQIIIITIKT